MNQNRSNNIYANIAEIDGSKNVDNGIIENNNKTDDLTTILSFGEGNSATLHKVTFQLAKKAIEKACLDVITNGFSFEQVQDDNYAITSTKTEGEDNKFSLDKDKNLNYKRERLGDLQSVLYTSAIQNLSNIDTFVSVTDIVMRCFIKTDNKYINGNKQYVYYNELTGKNTVFYGFVFNGCIRKGEKEKKVIYPTSRVTLLGIQPIIRVENKDKTISYQGYLSGELYVFDEALIFVTEYAVYHELFEAIFQLQATLLGNITQEMKINNILHVTAESGYFALDYDVKDRINKTFSNLVNGASDGIITTNKYIMQVHNMKETGTIQKTGLDVFGNAVGFITGIPQSVLFGTQQKTWATTGEEDRIKYEFFLKMLAEVYFLPVLQQFCKIFALENWEQLEYKTDALIREKLNIFSTIVPEEVKTDERLMYIGMEVDKLLGIDSKAKAEIKKQLGVEKDSQNSKEDIKKKSNNSKNSSKSSKKNSK